MDLQPEAVAMDTMIESRVREMEELIKNQQYSEVETIWLESIDGGMSDTTTLLHLADMMTQAGQGEKAAGLLLLLVDPLVSDNELEAACLVVNEAAKAGPMAPGIKDYARKAYQARFSEVPGIEKVLDQAEHKFGHNPKDFTKYLEERASYRVGDYLYHDAGWGLGKVVGLDFEKESLVVDFDDKPAHPVALKAVTQFFRKLPKEHILARKAADITAVKVEAEDDPARLIRTCMQSLEGKIQLRRVKDLLVPDVIAKTNWSKWWNGVKLEMSKRGMLRVGAGTNPLLELLQVPTTQEDEYAELLAASHTPVQFARVILKYLDVSEEKGQRATFLDKQMRKFFDLILLRDPVPVADKVLGKFLLDDVTSTVDGFSMDYSLDVAEVVANDDEFISAMEHVGIADYEARLLKTVEETRSDWAKLFARALLAHCPDSWDSIATALRDAGETELLFKHARRIYDHAYKADPEFGKLSEQFMWLAPLIIADGAPSDFGLETAPSNVLNDLLRLGMDIFHRMERGERRAKPLLLTYRNVLARGNNKLVKEILDACDEEGAKHLLQSIVTNRALSEARIEALAQMIFDKFPALELATRPTVDLEDEESGEILATANGHQRKRQELNDLLNVQIPAIQKAVGEAIALGDVSENAELDAARAKEDVLRSQANQLTTDIDRSRIVTQDEIDGSLAGFGTVVELRNTESGSTDTYTILGRWDADSAKGVISDISAIGRGVKGAKAGEVRSFTTPDGKEVSYEVVSVKLAKFE